MGKEPKPPKCRYACPHCLDTFTEAGSRDCHVRVVHEKRRDHKCPHCNSRFGTAGNMRTHCSNVHEKVRAHKCPHCDSRFGQATHIRLSLLESPSWP